MYALRLASRRIPNRFLLPSSTNVGLKQKQQQRNASSSFWADIAASTPVVAVQNEIVALHDWSGLPWWATIILNTIILRTVITLPLTIYQEKIICRLERISGEMPAIEKEVKREMAIAVKRYNWDFPTAKQKYQETMQKQWDKLVVRDNCHPMKKYIVLYAQIPIFVFQSMAVRNLVYAMPDQNDMDALLTATQMTVGGFGWIPNLGVPDASWILPVAYGMLNLLIVEANAAVRRGRTPSKFGTYATYFYRTLSVVLVPIAAAVPSALCLYWVSSAGAGLAQNLLLFSPRVRSFFGISSRTTPEHPYRRIVDHFLRRNREKDAF